MQPLFVEAVQIAHDLFQVTRDPFHGDRDPFHGYPPRWSPPQGDATWMARVSLDNLMARLRDHHRGGSVVLHARITLTCILPLMIEIQGDYHWECPSCKKTTGRTSLDT
eukprot:3817999-Pyramimonas_sp.AAC.1